MRRRHAGIRTAALLLTTVLAFAGCGGAGGKRAAVATGSSASGLPRAEYIAQLDAICEESHVGVKRYARRAARFWRIRDDGARLRAKAALFARWVELDRRHGERLRAVEPAPAYRAEAERYLAATTAAEALQPRLAEAMRNGDPSRYRFISELVELHSDDAHSAAVAFGFKVCGGQRKDEDDGPAAGRERGESEDEPAT